ncbi:hypothetical protein [Parendozoicomonas sp. Alg238-R29]|uniref:hypothetical protein n=1 Tax=Parendozoicomonas sp. Alg238-R29 TaxID=2993446 RepID=UPI00248E4F2E|nr:hypothetical protein [Parendozoicomonas sp. Alg238-R29]
MNSRSQDDLDHLPSISLSPDDMPERTPDRGKKTPGKKPSGKSETSSSRFPFATVVLSIAFLTLAAGGYLQVQALQNELQEARSQLAATASLLGEVSGAVSETGESLSKNDTKVKDELKAVNFEIRKLWDLSNKRNRSNIEAQGQRIDALNSSFTKARKELEGSVDQIGKNTRELASAEKILSALQKEVRAVNADVVAGSTITREQVDALQKTVDNLSVSVKKATSENQRFTSDIKTQVKDYAEKMKAIDAHRQQVNRRLLQLENSIRNLESGSRAGLTVEPTKG